MTAGRRNKKEHNMKLKVTKSGLLKTYAAKTIKKMVPGSEEKQPVNVVDFSVEYEYVDGDLSYLLGVNSKMADDIGFDDAKWGAIIGLFDITINEVVVSKVSIQKITRKNSDKGNLYTLFFRTESISETQLLPVYMNDKDNPTSFMIEKSPEDESVENKD